MYLLRTSLFAAATMAVAWGQCETAPVLRFEVKERPGAEARSVSIEKLAQGKKLAFFFKSSMAIDADGAPNAYHPSGSQGLDDLANAGKPGDWWGLVTHDGTKTGVPVIQPPTAPAPGFYVSMTSLVNPSKQPADPHRYVDSTKIPYIALPRQLMRRAGIGLGDYAVVLNPATGKSSYAVFADVGPDNALGEGSIALATAIGVNPDARKGGTRLRIFYLVFPASNVGWPKKLEQIEAKGKQLLEAWGGESLLSACAAKK
jgi:hypothetical protein